MTTQAQLQEWPCSQTNCLMIIAMNHDDKEGGLIGVMIRVEGNA